MHEMTLIYCESQCAITTSREDFALRRLVGGNCHQSKRLEGMSSITAMADEET